MTFRPESYEDARLSHRPLKRSRMSKALAPRLKTSPARKTKRRPRKPKPSTVKRKAWNEFSVFIRTRGADAEGMNACFTCEREFHWKELQAGHFIRGRLNANLFEQRAVWPQCLRCNIHFQGNVVVYYKKMLEMYGQEVIDELILQNSKTKKWVPGEMESLLEHFKTLNAANLLVQKVRRERGRGQEGVLAAVV